MVFVIFFFFVCVIQKYLKSERYGRDGDPFLVGAVVFHKIFEPGSTGNWDYSIRMNTTEFIDECQMPTVPSTKNSGIDTLQNSMLLSDVTAYSNFGFTALQVITISVQLRT